MDELRQRTYWQILSPTVTIAEWRYACFAILERETFHKMPLPAVFLGVVEEMRQQDRTARAQQESLRTRQSVVHTSADDTWARLHVEMVMHGIPRLGHFDEAALRCEHYATIDPDNAPDWLAEAAWWRQGAPGRPLLPSMVAHVRDGDMWR